MTDRSGPDDWCDWCGEENTDGIRHYDDRVFCSDNCLHDYKARGRDIGMTPQQAYDLELAQLMCAPMEPGNRERLDQLLELGPPEPEDRDGHYGKVLSLQHRAERGDVEAAENLAHLEAEGPE